MSEATPAPASDGPLSIDAATALLTAPEPEPEEEEKKSEAEAKPALDDIEAATEPDAEEEVEADAEIEEEDDSDAEPAPQIDPPRSWSKEDAATWAQLPAEVQQVVAKREADRDKAVMQKAQETAQLASQLQRLAQSYEETAPLVIDRAAQAEQVLIQRWGNVDWVAVAREYSAEEYNQFRAEFESERGEVEYLKGEATRIRQESTHAAELAYQRFLAEEAQKLPDMAPELIDPEKGAERRQKVAKHLFDNGYDPETVKHMSAFELTTTWKAMQWDEAQKKARAQTTLPRRDTPKQAPKGISPNSATPAASPRRALQGLETRLTKERSVDAAVELLMARNSGRK